MVTNQNKTSDKWKQTESPFRLKLNRTERDTQIYNYYNTNIIQMNAIFNEDLDF